MTEFRDRMALQRRALQIANRSQRSEELYGLSFAAITRWSAVNQIDQTSELMTLIREVSEKLLFIANRSQDQITSEYCALTNSVNETLEKLDTLMK